MVSGICRQLYNGKQHNRERTQRTRPRIVDDKLLTPRSSGNIVKSSTDRNCQSFRVSIQIVHWLLNRPPNGRRFIDNYGIQS